MFWTVAFGAILLFLLWELLRPECHNRFKPGKFYYTKKCLFRILLFLNARKKQQTDQPSDTGSRGNRGYGRSIQSPDLLDTCQPLEDDPLAIDTVYFNGFDTDGTSLALRIARRHNREGELWLWLNVPSIGFFQHPILPDAGVYNMEESGYRALGAKLQVIEPMRSWRVTYNGLLRKGLCNDANRKPEQFVNVRMTFKWECFNDPFNFDLHLDKNLLADAIAREKWTRDFWAKLRGKHQTHYEQCGELTGQIEIEGHDTLNVNLKSFRDHTFGVRNWETFYRYAIHFIWIEEVGVMAMVAVLWMPDYISLIKSGYLAFANGETFPVTGIDLDIEKVTKDDIPAEEYSFTFNAADELYKVDLFTIETPEAYHYRKRTSRVLERFCTYTVNGRKARGLTEYHYRNPYGPPMKTELPKMVPLLKEPDITDECKGQLTLTFQDKECQSSLLTGGKGSQLALLTSIQKELDTKVPRGFCLTLAAFQQQLQNSKELETSLEKIVTAIRNENLQVLQGLCSEAVELLASCRVIQPIESQITSQLKAVFGEAHNRIPLAVRSSAAGEDGSEASSAGQMETYLGVRGVESLLEAVRKCWASAYAYQAVEYRRQQGQPVRTSMAVVVQEMVSSDVSGVLFTNDPVTGNPNRMVLDASFGLGEAVVSGKANPDTIIIQRLFNNKLKIISKTLGEKNVEVRMTDSGGVQEIETAMGSTSLCCLDDKQIIKLCELALKVEEHFGSPRDIEWAFHEGEIYLLQARPITTIDQETDEDIIHEFDTPMPTGQERLTLGNIGEMMPGVVTALTGSVFGRAVDRATSVVGIDFGGGTAINFAMKSVISNCGRLFLNLTWISQVYSNSLLYSKNALEMSLLGQILDDHKMSMIKTYGLEKESFLARVYNMFNFYLYGCQVTNVGPLFHKEQIEYSLCGKTLADHTLELIRSYGKRRFLYMNFYQLLKFISYNGNIATGSPIFNKKVLELNVTGSILEDHTMDMMVSYGRRTKPSPVQIVKWLLIGNRKIKIADGWYEKLKSYSVGADCHTAAELYEAINRQLPDYYQIWETTIHKSARSGTYGGVVMGIVSGGKDEWSLDNYSDVALLLSQCNNVYSAEVPLAMRQIAKTIVDTGKERNFLEMSDTESVHYLSSKNCPAEICQMYEAFMERHGHRCIREAEFIEKSWRAEPEKLIRVLKTILKAKAYDEIKTNVPSLNDAVDQLKSSVSSFGRFLLKKWIVKKARDAVGQREFGKSVAVEVSDRFKQAYWRLADLLFQEGRIPERELMFHLTHYEIGQLVKTHSAKLVTKAIRRRKLLSVQAGMEFPRVCVGRSQPIMKKQEEEHRKTTFTLTGMPVSVGKVKGTARVVRSLDDASEIQRGDILVVCYTDVGWSPYFPLISGLVTEMGGLVSHGAVVAREYGLPCVVNVPGATHSFKSGDFVELDGTNGSIHRLENIS